MRRAFRGLLVLMAACVAFATVCHAAPAYYNGEAVVQAGLIQDPASTFRVIVKIRYLVGAGEPGYKYYQALRGREKEILAVALTAQTSGKKIRYRTNLGANGLGDQTKPKGSEANPLPLYGLFIVD